MVAMDDHSRHTIATQNMLIIDSKREIYMGVGLNTWPPVELGRDEVMIPEQVAKYLGCQIGDQVSLYVDWG